MRFEAVCYDSTIEMRSRKTGELLDVVAVMPDHLSDLAALVSLVPRDMAGELARMASDRAAGLL